MVIMASGTARGRVRTTTEKSRNMAAILQQVQVGWEKHATLVYTVIFCSIDTCQYKVSADKHRVTISRAQV